ncbi:MAG: hypothetical protein JNJ88_17845 [Planctomycetes bacterium]|nr:hypothetical protein [Planctomycetota bacterium]
MTHTFVTLAAAALLTAGAPAQSSDWPIESDGFRGTLTAPWGTFLSQGYAPITIDLESTLPSEQVVRIEAKSDVRANSGVQVTHAIRLGPRERATAELFVPVNLGRGSVHLYGDYGSYDIRIAAGGETKLVAGVIRTATGTGDTRHVAWILPTPPDTPVFEEQALDLCWVHVPNFSSLTSSGTRTANKKNNVRSLWLVSSRMPRRPEAYSCLNGIVIDASAGMPPADRLEPVLAWARTGGILAFLGASESAVRALSGTAGWMEPRFRLPGSSSSEAYRFGLGTLVITPERSVDNCPDLRSTLSSLLQLRPSVQSGGRPSPLDSWAERIPGLGQISPSFSVLLILAFALVIGPVNFLLIRRWNRPALLLLTIPVLSVGTATIVFTYALLRNGLDVSAVSCSFTVLDQRAHVADTAEAKSFYIGLNRWGGLIPGTGTLVFPAPPARIEDAWVHDRSWTSRAFSIDLSEGVLLSGGYAPSREMTQHRVLTDRASRLRIRASRKGPMFQIENGLETRIERLTLRDPQGGMHQLAAPLEAGGTADLEIAAATDAELKVLDQLGFPGLPRATYLAALSKSPFVDRCGIEVHERASRHLVLGILEAEESKW